MTVPPPTESILTWIDMVARLITRVVSSLAGYLADVSIPTFMRSTVYSIFAVLSGAQLDQAEYPITEYRSVGELFVRRLKPGLRPIEGDFVSPVDGVLRRVIAVDQLPLSEVKGERYTAAQLIGSSTEAYSNGTAFEFYLSPKDYHRVHAPLSFTVTAIRRLPGPLYPVNTLGLALVEGLYARNERVVIEFMSSLGRGAFVFVGALNVGSITVEPSASIVGNQITVGQEIGRFNLGSTVILLLEGNYGAKKLGSILLGQPLI